MSNIPHCVIRCGDIENINLLIYNVCIDPKNSANFPPKSVFLAQKSHFRPKIRTKCPYHLSKMISFGRKFDKLQYDM